MRTSRRALRGEDRGEAPRSRPAPGAVMPVLGLVLLAALVPPAYAQTGLLVVGRTGDSLDLGATVTRLRWPHGPSAAGYLSTRRGDPADWRSTLEEFSGTGASAVVVVPVGLDPGALRLVRTHVPTISAVVVRITPVIHAGDEGDLGRLLRQIDRVAVEAAYAIAQTTQQPFPLQAINVTATRTTRDGLRTPSSVAVITSDDLLRRGADNAMHAFRELAGLDVEGVGTNQPRPVIRGLSGHRILLLEDGLRLNNPRRRQESGEPPALVSVTDLERVEVVRGPASVLYGSGAIGGVVNLITRTPETLDPETAVHGTLQYRYGTADNRNSPSGSVFGRVGRLAYRVAGSYRHTESYDAPSGQFGAVAFAGDTRVQDTGVEDHSLNAYAGYRFSALHSGFVKLERYRATDAGFGFVDPADLAFVDPAESAEEIPTVQLLWPRHEFEKISVGYRGSGLRAVVVDEVSVVGYAQSNERQFNTNINATLGAPGTELIVRSENVTDVDTRGVRVEMRKFLGATAVLTYGVDYLRDHSSNTDTSTTTIIGFGPPTVQGRGTEPVPTATFRSAGAFVHTEISLTDRATVSLGGRYQDVRARTLETPGVTEPLVDATDRTVVGGGGLAYRLTDRLNAVVSVGRAFRSPNLVERFFSGPAPEGRAVWIRNPDLRAETSLNSEIGVKYSSARFHLEAFAFRNIIRDGIRREPTGNEVNGRTELRNVNVDELRYTGVETSGGVGFHNGWSAAAQFTLVDAKNVSAPDEPLGESYGNKVGGSLRYGDPAGRFWAEYHVRHQGSRTDVELTGPVGPDIPSFTVHGLRGGIAVAGNQRLDITLNNLTNVLYAEASNVGFFRPEPKRNVVITIKLEF